MKLNFAHGLVVEIHNLFAVRTVVVGHGASRMAVQEARHHVGVVEAPAQFFAHGFNFILYALQNRAKRVFRIVQETN